MKISKKSQYGLRAMIFLARNSKDKKPISLKEISGKELIPFNYLEKVFLDFEKSNLVRGIKGRSGGYILFKKPSEISVFDIVRSLEKDIRLIECSSCIKEKRCLAKSVWGEIENSFLLILKKNTLLKLIK